MEVLVTGHKGFIGSHLVPLLEEHKVFGYDLQNKRDIFDDDFESFVEGTDVIIHLAALTNVTGSFRNPAEHFQTNTLGTARVLELAMKHNKRVIFPSTGAYYIPDTSPYAKSKTLADQLCQEAMNHIPVTILRFFNIYGDGMNQDSGSIIYAFLREAKEKGTVTVYGRGRGKRDFINVEDIARIIKAALDKKWIGQIVDVGTGEGHSINDMARIFGEETGASVVHDTTKTEIGWQLADTTKLRELYRRPLVSSFDKDMRRMAKNYESAN